MRNHHTELWEDLLSLENEGNLAGTIWNTLKKVSLHDKEEQFFWDDQQISVFDFIGG